MTAVRAPFTPDQVAALNRWQTTRPVHPFTCGNRDDHEGEGILTATPDGWTCPECDYAQDWAHDFMLQEQDEGWLGPRHRTIGADTVGGILISTAWIDFPADYAITGTIETMIFGGPLHMEQATHRTLQQATEFHRHLVDATTYAIEEGIWTPVEHPDDDAPHPPEGETTVPTIDLNLHGVGEDVDAWADLAGRLDRLVHVGTEWKLAAIPEGMSGGGVSLALRIDYPPGTADGSATMITEMSLDSWIAATCALRGKYPEAFRGTPLEAPNP